jgi:cyclic dehypoxanthinyl futalosine synthase
MGRLSFNEALQLYKHATTEELTKAAHAERSHHVSGDQARYIIMRIVSYTNICVADCSYCAFYRKPGHNEGYVLSHETILEKIQNLLDRGGSLVAMEGGFNPQLKIDHYESMFYAVRQTFGDRIEIYGPTGVEVLFIARNSKIPLHEAYARLKDSGLRWIPGGGAEILTPEWRKKLSPKKYSVDQYFMAMHEAQKAGFGTTSTMVIGFGEPLEARIEHLDRIRQAQDAHPGFASFLCWTYQNQNTSLGGTLTSQEDYLRTIAISRLYLDNIPTIRASMLTQGPLGAQALRGGADDFDIALEDQVTQKAGVTIDDNIERVLGYVHAAGLNPVKRRPFAIPDKPAL